LQEFWTCLSWHQTGLLDRILFLAPQLRGELRRRAFPAEVMPFVRTYGFREAGRLTAERLGWSLLTRSETDFFSIDNVYHSLDRRVAQRLEDGLTIKAAYAYEDGALAIFQTAKKLGITCIYEHPTGYWRKVRQLQLEEAELHPEWAGTLGALHDSDEKLQRKDAELALADLIVTPSSFARETLCLSKGLTAPVHVVAYGASRNQIGSDVSRQKGKLRVLFVGALSQAKGLSYLLDAAGNLKNEIALTLVGRRISATVPKPAALEKHRWIPSLSHSDLMREMSLHDVLVLPSLHEGFGLVITEAMAQGLTVITTPHTAGPDVITDGTDGFIVAIRSAAAIEEKLALLHGERDRLVEMQKAARRKADSLCWENYRRTLVNLAQDVIGRSAIA
jgi:glycosyltransferase involved in cell wall biosynthesis